MLWTRYNPYKSIRIDIIRKGIAYTSRKLDIAIPVPPKVEIIANPIEEQLAQVLDKIPNVVPDNKEDLLIFRFALLIIYIFILIRIPNNIEDRFVRINPKTASSGR